MIFILSMCILLVLSDLNKKRVDGLSATVPTSILSQAIVELELSEYLLTLASEKIKLTLTTLKKTRVKS